MANIDDPNFFIPLVQGLISTLTASPVLKASLGPYVNIVRELTNQARQRAESAPSADNTTKAAAWTTALTTLTAAYNAGS